MKKYIGTKIIEAKPMNRGDYNKYRGWQIPANENPEDDGYLVKYSDDYESWSPKEQFDKAYRCFEDGMEFSKAIELLKLGYRLARKGWNGKKMCIFLTKGSDVEYKNLKEHNQNALVCARSEDIKNEDQLVHISDHIDMIAADGSITIGWQPSQVDMLAEDWEIVQ